MGEGCRYQPKLNQTQRNREGEGEGYAPEPNDISPESQGIVGKGEGRSAGWA